MQIRNFSVAIFALLFAASSAFADIIFTGSAGPNQDATAVFHFVDANHLTLTLSDTGDINDISSVLDDFHFNLSASPSIASLTNISEHGFVDCTASTNTTPNCTNNNVTNANSTWSLGLTGAHIDMAAGNGMHPYGIVNNSIFTNANLDGLRNSQHNPYLLGDVTFSILLTGLTGIPTISNVDFTFGTRPEHVPGILCTPPNPNCVTRVTLPEPASAALVALALLGMGFVRRRRQH